MKCHHLHTLLDSPPPGYSHTESRIPLPLGPEMPRAPMPPQPIIVRKSRGYKGILLVMMAGKLKKSRKIDKCMNQSMNPFQSS
jgi:hypothetical protein